MEPRILLAMSPHNDKTLAVRSDDRETGKPWETSTEDATFHEVLVRQKVLSYVLHAPPKIPSQGIPHVWRIVFCASRHGVIVSDHL